MIAAFDHLPVWAKVPALLLHLATGFGIGRLYFHGVWRTAQSFTNRPAAAIGWTLLRFALLAGVLTVTALEGALPLLSTALGLVLARPGAMRRAQ
ncbi:MAG TPA: ATP synthase subunit I [Rhizomicrobium sp.]